jgi:hypothetical protein
MWSAKTEVIPVIIGATGTISKSFRKYMSNTTRMHEIIQLRKTAILGTAHIFRKELMYKCKTLNLGNNMTCNYRITTTVHILKTCFVSDIESCTRL